MEQTAETATSLDLLAVGETIVDFIATEQTEDGLKNATTFQRYLGGSPANIAVYVSKLGGQAAVVSKTGIGAFGQFLKAQLRHHGVVTDYLVMDHRVHTTVIFVSRTSGTPDFEAFRDGDYKLLPEEVTAETIAQTRAREHGLANCTFQEGDACNLHQLPDQAFDLVVSVFGAMFAPNPFDVAREKVRVTRPGAYFAVIL